jgi:hypothetical protein
MNDNRDDARIHILLAEYQIAQANRDHMESTRWIIGGIFIAASLAMYAFSFTSDLRENFQAVSLLAVFSMALMLIWGLYNVRSQPYVDLSYERLWEIERELQALGSASYPKLHLTIRKQTGQRGWGRGITCSFFVVLAAMWSARVLTFCPNCWLLVPLSVSWVFGRAPNGPFHPTSHTTFC